MGAVCIASHYLSGGVGESNGGALTISKVAEDASIWCDMFHRQSSCIDIGVAIYRYGPWNGENAVP